MVSYTKCHKGGLYMKNCPQCRKSIDVETEDYHLEIENECVSLTAPQVGRLDITWGSWTEGGKAVVVRTTPEEIAVREKLQEVSSAMGALLNLEDAAAYQRGQELFKETLLQVTPIGELQAN